MSIWTDPSKLPDNRETIADADLITIDVWAVLQGVSKVTAQSNLSKSGKRRAAGQPRPGDMPAPDDRAGQTPLFLMGSYRAWASSRPGRSGSRGSGSRGGAGEGRRVRLPIECPHCRRQITAADVEAVDAMREKFARAREDGRTVEQAAGQAGMIAAGLAPETWRSWEMARRRAGRIGPVTVEDQKAIG